MASDKMSLADQAYVSIKQRIDTMYFLPGQYLTEAAICAVLAIGRTPVHQALQRLSIEKLVEIIPRKGIVVLPSPLGQVMAILDARMAVEVELARRAATRASPAQIAALDALLAKAARPHGGGEIDSFLAADRAFHGAIAELGGNPILAEFSISLHEKTERAWYLNYWRTLDVTGTHTQHRRVIEAIRRGDGQAAGEAMRVHLEALATRFGEVQPGEGARHRPAPE